MCIALAAAVERTERKHHNFLPRYLWAHTQPPRWRARLSKQEIRKLCRPCVDLSNFLGAAAGRVGKDLQGKHHNSKRLFDVSGRAGFLAQHQFEIVNGSYCIAIRPVKEERRAGPARNQTRRRNARQRQKAEAPQARPHPTSAPKNHLRFRSFTALLSRGLSPKHHLGPAIFELRKSSAADARQQASAQSKRRRIPNQVETSRNSTAVARGCGNDKVLSPHPIGHRPALLPVHLQTGSCLLTTVGRLFESRQIWDCWRHPNEPDLEPQSAPRPFLVGSQPFSQVPPSRDSFLLVAAACPSCHGESCSVGLWYLAG